MKTTYSLPAKPPTPSTAAATWSVWRQDDSGTRFLIEANLPEENAQAMVREFEERGHKQTYWCSCGDK
jgi:hypothetical protein